MGGPKDLREEFPFDRSAGLFAAAASAPSNIKYLGVYSVIPEEEGMRPEKMAVFEEKKRARNGELVSEKVAMDHSQMETYLRTLPKDSIEAQQVKYGEEKLDFAVRTGKPLREVDITKLNDIDRPESLLPSNAFTPPTP